MRSAARISRTPREWHDHEAEERRRTCDQLLAELARRRAAGEPWLEWVDAGCPPLTEAQYEAQGGLYVRAARRGQSRLSG